MGRSTYSFGTVIGRHSGGSASNGTWTKRPLCGPGADEHHEVVGLVRLVERPLERVVVVRASRAAGTTRGRARAGAPGGAPAKRCTGGGRGVGVDEQLVQRPTEVCTPSVSEMCCETRARSSPPCSMSNHSARCRASSEVSGSDAAPRAHGSARSAAFAPGPTIVTSEPCAMYHAARDAPVRPFARGRSGSARGAGGSRWNRSARSARVSASAARSSSHDSSRTMLAWRSVSGRKIRGSSPRGGIVAPSTSTGMSALFRRSAVSTSRRSTSSAAGSSTARPT